jgi:hypothetical protein
MGKIYYSSDEMFSSTDLIRKSKPIFDLVASKSIEKAVILRDGKPSFILLDFFEYEKLMKDYISLKEENSKKNTLFTNKFIVNDNVQPEQKVDESEIVEEVYESSYDEIQNLEVDYEDKKTKAPLKEFWDE